MDKVEKCLAAGIVLTVVLLVAGFVGENRAKERSREMLKRDYGYSVADVKVFCKSVNASESDLVQSAALRLQFTRWTRGEIALNGDASRTAEAEATAESAQTLAIVGMANSMGRPR